METTLIHHVLSIVGRFIFFVTLIAITTALYIASWYWIYPNEFDVLGFFTFAE